MDPDHRYGLRLTLYLFATAMVAVPFGLLLDQVIRQGPLVEIDTAAAAHLQGYVRQMPLVLSVTKLVSFLGAPAFLWTILGGIIWNTWIRGGRRIAIFLTTSSILGAILDTAVKVAVSRPRPSLKAPVATAFGMSFPSGHAMLSAVIYGAILLVALPLLRSRRAKAVASSAVLVLVLAIGISRLVLGVHYITDVLGGWVLGVAWLAASTAAFSIWKQNLGLRPVAASQGVEPSEAGKVRRRVASGSTR